LIIEEVSLLSKLNENDGAKKPRLLKTRAGRRGKTKYAKCVEQVR
jgi:hypothetical protein